MHIVAFLAALLLSAFSSTAGVTGAFLLVPFQISVLGVGTPVASSTNHLYNVLAAPGGLSGYHEQNRIVWPLAGALVAGTLPGVLVGVYVRLRYLPDPGLFRPFVGSVLLLLGVALAVRGWLRRGESAREKRPVEKPRLRALSWRRLRYGFGTGTYSVNLPGIWFFSLAVGAVGGAYGVGGGVFTSAYLIGVCGLPVHTTAGATLLATFAASCVGVAGFTLAEWIGVASSTPAAPDGSLALALGLGGLLGGRIGAHLQSSLHPRFISTLLALLMLALGVAYMVPR
jgi:uncharacterized membrane protein YfcA